MSPCSFFGGQVFRCQGLTLWRCSVFSVQSDVQSYSSNLVPYLTYISIYNIKQFIFYNLLVPTSQDLTHPKLAAFQAPRTYPWKHQRSDHHVLHPADLRTSREVPPSLLCEVSLIELYILGNLVDGQVDPRVLDIPWQAQHAKKNQIPNKLPSGNLT